MEGWAGAEAAEAAGKSVVDVARTPGDGSAEHHPETPWATQFSTLVSSESDAWLGYRSAEPMTSADCAWPWIWTPCASPGVGSKLTVGPVRESADLESGQALPGDADLLGAYRDVRLLEAQDVLRAGVVDTLVTLGIAAGVPASGLEVVPHADSESAANPTATASFAEGMGQEGSG